MEDVVITAEQIEKAAKECRCPFCGQGMAILRAQAEMRDYESNKEAYLFQDALDSLDEFVEVH